MTRIDNSRVIRSPHGTELSAKSWLTEAPLRMLMNNLDPDVAEKPGELVVYGGIGRAARDLGGFRPDRAPRCARWRPTRRCLCSRASRSASSARMPDAPRRADRELQPRARPMRPGSISTSSIRSGLMMYGQMTAGSWIYIGTQGIVQGTYETFVEVGRQPLSAARSRANGS